jgi:hypothetical protein
MKCRPPTSHGRMRSARQAGGHEPAPQLRQRIIGRAHRSGRSPRRRSAARRGRSVRAASAIAAAGRSAAASTRSIDTVSKLPSSNGRLYMSPRRNSQCDRPCAVHARARQPQRRRRDVHADRAPRARTEDFEHQARAGADIEQLADRGRPKFLRAAAPTTPRVSGCNGAAPAAVPGPALPVIAAARSAAATRPTGSRRVVAPQRVPGHRPLSPPAPGRA